MNEIRANAAIAPTAIGTSALTFERLSPALGAVVHNLDLAAPLADSVIEAIRDGLDEHQVLFFRDQTLSPAQQRDFAARFGELHIHPVYPQHETVPEIMILEFDENLKGHQNNWHTDVTFIETPPFGSVLYADDVPPAGGDTIWASSYAAFEALSPAFQNFLGSLYAVHDFAKNFTPDRFRTYGVDNKLADTSTNTNRCCTRWCAPTKKPAAKACL
jgi:taurine dioxygenase